MIKKILPKLLFRLKKNTLLIVIYLFSFLGNAQITSSSSIDPQIMELIDSYKKNISSGNSNQAQEIKKEILELANHAYPDKLDEINNMLKIQEKKQAEPDSKKNTNSNLASKNNSINKDVIEFSVKGNQYYAIKPKDNRFEGLYTYPGKEARFWKYVEGEPIVELKENQQGRFQAHGVAPLKITWWLECDRSGIIESLTGPGGTRYWLVVRYEEAGEYNYPEKGSFDIMTLDVIKENGKMVILGEREKTN